MSSPAGNAFVSSIQAFYDVVRLGIFTTGVFYVSMMSKKNTYNIFGVDVTSNFIALYGNIFFTLINIVVWLSLEKASILSKLLSGAEKEDAFSKVIFDSSYYNIFLAISSGSHYAPQEVYMLGFGAMVWFIALSLFSIPYNSIDHFYHRYLLIVALVIDVILIGKLMKILQK